MGVKVDIRNYSQRSLSLEVTFCARFAFPLPFSFLSFQVITEVHFFFHKLHRWLQLLLPPQPQPQPSFLSAAAPV